MKWVVNDEGHTVSVLNGNVPEGYEVVVECLAEEITTWTFPRTKANAAAALTLVQLTWVTRAPPLP